MVIPSKPARRRMSLGTLTTELVIAMGILATVMIPLAYSLAQEQKLCRAYYFQAVAMELLDGEMEILAAGEWKAYPAGRQAYTVDSEAARKLPAGRFVLTIDQKGVLLEWIPARRGFGGRVARQVPWAEEKLEFRHPHED